MSAADSENIKRDYSFTVRLSPKEKATLEALAERFDLDKSATVRRVLQLALASEQPLPNVGRFVPFNAGELAFPVRLSGKDTNGG